MCGCPTESHATAYEADDCRLKEFRQKPGYGMKRFAFVIQREVVAYGLDEDAAWAVVKREYPNAEKISTQEVELPETTAINAAAAAAAAKMATSEKGTINERPTTPELEVQQDDRDPEEGAGETTRGEETEDDVGSGIGEGGEEQK